VCYNYINYTKFVKLAYFRILEDFCVLYYIKVTKFFKLSKFGLFKIFVCYNT